MYDWNLAFVYIFNICWLQSKALIFQDFLVPIIQYGQISLHFAFSKLKELHGLSVNMENNKFWDEIYRQNCKNRKNYQNCKNVSLYQISINLQNIIDFTI